MKLPNGAGSVEVLPDGRARVRAVVEGKRRTVGPIWPDAETAERMRRAWSLSRQTGAILAPAELTLGTHGTQWLDAREIDGSKRRAVVRSIRVERCIWDRHVAASDLARKPVATITSDHVEAFARWLRRRTCVSAIHTKAGVVLRETARPLSASMQKHALRLVRQALRAAGNDAADDVTIALGGPRPRDLSEDWLREDEIAALLACPGLPLRNRTVYACALGLALRLDDIKAIEVAHVELDARVPGPAVRVFVSKSGRWHRVPILPWLAPWLRAHIAALPAASRYLFPAPDGDRYGASFDFGWAQKLETGRPRKPSALEVAGVARKMRFHDLRGTTATHLALGTWGRRWSLSEVQAMLSHSDSRVTERYVRRAIDTLAEAAAGTPGCPGLPMTGTGGSQNPPVFSDAPAAIRTRDLSLRKAKRLRVAARGYEHPGQRMGNEVAAEVVAASLRGRISGALLDELAWAVLGAGAPLLALRVLERGPHASRAALALAAEILRAAPVAQRERSGR